MYTVFFVCFGVGLGYTLISFLLGHLFDAVDFGGGDAGADIGGHVDSSGADFDAGPGDISSADSGADFQVSPLKPVIMASFVTVFGGVGLIMLRFGINEYVAATIAGFAALAVAFLIYRYIVVPLYRLQSTSAIAQRELVGAKAKVTLRIPQGKYGKITYVVNGNTYNAPAKAEDGAEILSGESVEIVYIEKNTFYVKKTKKEASQWVVQN